MWQHIHAINICFIGIFNDTVDFTSCFFILKTLKNHQLHRRDVKISICSVLFSLLPDNIGGGK